MSKVEDFLKENPELGVVIIWYDEEDAHFVAALCREDVDETLEVRALSPFSLLDKLDRKGE